MMCDALANFREIYNELKPHSSLNRRTPAQCYYSSSRRWDPSPPEWVYPPGAAVKKLTPQGTLHASGPANGSIHFLLQSDLLYSSRSGGP